MFFWSANRYSILRNLIFSLTIYIIENSTVCEMAATQAANEAITTSTLDELIRNGCSHSDSLQFDELEVMRI